MQESRRVSPSTEPAAVTGPDGSTRRYRRGRIERADSGSRAVRNTIGSYARPGLNVGGPTVGYQVNAMTAPAPAVINSRPTLPANVASANRE